MKLKELEGYRYADRKYTMGYVSRRINPMEAEVRKAGGKRKGELYVLIPCNTSSRYCYRQYLIV